MLLQNNPLLKARSLPLPMKLIALGAFLLVIASTASASCVAHYSMNDSLGGKDTCQYLYNLTDHGVTTGLAGVFDEAFQFVRTDPDYLDDSDLDLPSDFTICFWIKPITVGNTQGYISSYKNVDANVNYLITLHSTNNSVRLMVADGVDEFFTYSNQSLAAGSWYHVCAWYSDTLNTAGFWMNNSRKGEGASATSLSMTTVDPLQIGRFNSIALNYMNAVMDDVWILNHTASSTEIGNLFLYGNLTGPSITPVGCTVNSTSPANNTHTNLSRYTFTGNITCYQNIATYQCDLFANGTRYGTNSSLTNETLFEITSNTSWADDAYQWNFSCTNTTYTNSSTNNTIIIDTASPQLLLWTPLNWTNYIQGTTNYRNVSCYDTYAYNLTCWTYFANGTLYNITKNDTSYGNTTITLTNNFTNGDTPMNSYFMQCACSDAHTKKNWKADQILNDTISMKIKKDGKWVNLDWENITHTSYTELNDRIKWQFTATVNANGNIREVIQLKCDDPLYLLNQTNAHFICGSFWIDFQDLKDQGYTFEYTKVTDYKYKIKVKKNNAGAPGDTIICDPETGGLNEVWNTTNYTIGCGNLSTANTVYTLTNNVTSNGTCFNISSSNITIDCNGYYINYAGTSDGYGVYANGAYNNITVQNCHATRTVSGSSNVVYLRSGNIYKLFNNTMNVPGGTGFFFYGAAAITSLNITGNNITSTSHNKIYYAGAASIVNNTLTVSDASAMALNLYDVSGAVINNLNASSPAGYGILYDSTTVNVMVTLSNLSAMYPAYFMSSSSNNIIINTTLTGTNISAVTAIITSINNTVTNSTLVTSIGYNAQALIGSSIILTNNNMNNSYRDSAADTSTITVNWYYESTLSNCTSGLPLLLANTTATNTTGGRVFSLLTDAFTGAIPRQTITEYIYNVAGRQFTNNHTINGTFGGYLSSEHSINITSSINDSYCLSTDFPPNVTGLAPSYYACWSPPCNVIFTYLPTDELGFSNATLWANFTGTWTANATNATDIVNNTDNIFTVTLGYGYYLWNVNVTDPSGTTAFAASNITLLVATPLIAVCNASNATWALAMNFCFYDEEDLQPITADMNATFWLYNSDRTLNKTLSLEWDEVNCSGMCVFPGNDTYLADSFQVYDNRTNYRSRNYFLDNVTIGGNLTYENISLYLLNTSFAYQYSITVEDKSGTKQPDTIIHFDRYYPETNEYRTIAMVKTSDAGTASTYLFPNDKWFKIIAIQNHAVLNIFNPQVLPCDPGSTSCTLTLFIPLNPNGEFFDYYQNFAHNCSYNNSNFLVTCTWADTSGLQKYVVMRVHKQEMLSNTRVCENSSTSTSGSVYCNLSTFGNGTYSISFYAHFQAETLLESFSIPLGGSTGAFFGFGVFPAMILFLAIIGLGALNPQLTLINGLFAVIALWVLGMWEMSLTAIVALAIVIGLFIMKQGRKDEGGG